MCDIVIGTTMTDSSDTNAAPNCIAAATCNTDTTSNNCMSPLAFPLPLVIPIPLSIIVILIALPPVVVAGPFRLPLVVPSLQLNCALMLVQVAMPFLTVKLSHPIDDTVQLSQKDRSCKNLTSRADR